VKRCPSEKKHFQQFTAAVKSFLFPDNSSVIRENSRISYDPGKVHCAEVWDPKKSGLYKEQLSNKVWLFFPQKHLNLHLFGFQEKFESNRPGKFESNGPFEPIDVAQ